MAILGKNIFIYQGSTGTTPIIAAAKTCSISYQTDLIEIASPSTAEAREYVAGRDDWSISLNHLVTAGAPFAGLLKVRHKYTISVVVGGQRRTGTVICQQADLNGAVGSLAEGSVKFKGTGRCPFYTA